MDGDSLKAAPEPLRRAVMAGNVGTVVKLARKAAGLTQRELGDLCGGYGQSTISRIEDSRTANPPPNTLRRIAEVTGIPSEWVGIASSPNPARNGEPPSRRRPAPDEMLGDTAPVTERTVQHLQICIENYWRLDDEIGGRMLRRAVTAQFDEAARLFSTGKSRGSVRDQMVGVTTELARLAGWMLFDGRHFASADRYYRQAATQPSPGPNASWRRHPAVTLIQPGRPTSPSRSSWPTWVSPAPGWANMTRPFR